MDASKRDSLVNLLFSARLEGRQLVLPRDLEPPTRDSGIAIHSLVASRLVKEGWEPLRCKIPGTAAAMTSKLGVKAVDSVHAGIEVAECRFPMRWLPLTPGILADGAAAGRYGKPRRKGRGSDVMGHPLKPLLWLAEERRRWGEGLRAGEMISTGSMTGMFRVKEGGHSVKAIFGGETIVEVSFGGGREGRVVPLLCPIVFGLQ